MLEFAEWLQTTRPSVAIRLVDAWSIPVLQSVHILMIGVVFVSILVVALRVLGRMRMDEPLADVVARFAPWLWGGLAVMLLTGALLAIAEPVRQVMTLSFWLKMTLLVVGTAAAAVFQRSVRVQSAGGAGVSAEPSGAQRALAGATIVLWLAIIFLGRAIGYDYEIWGDLSPGHSTGAEQG